MADSSVDEADPFRGRRTPSGAIKLLPEERTAAVQQQKKQYEFKRRQLARILELFVPLRDEVDPDRLISFIDEIVGVCLATRDAGRAAVKASVASFESQAKRLEVAAATLYSVADEMDAVRFGLFVPYVDMSEQEFPDTGLAMQVFVDTYLPLKDMPVADHENVVRNRVRAAATFSAESAEDLRRVIEHHRGLRAAGRRTSLSETTTRGIPIRPDEQALGLEIGLVWEVATNTPAQRSTKGESQFVRVLDAALVLSESPDDNQCDWLARNVIERLHRLAEKSPKLWDLRRAEIEEKIFRKG